ncbi:alpha/beta fold hydrolase [Falsiroseomonas ponticola]|jgi:hypothetical protein|uniref:hypothetical protein n=1 Tax=Falsiroseomonas ponticola TaxID=2786951 RepID=UPI0019318A2C|nr:hypothetical protein [Roseomonas ponticola]
MRLVTLWLGLVLAGPALAQERPGILDLPAFPGLSERARGEAARMLTRNLPRAFALGPEGRFAWQSGGPEGEAEQKALESCGRGGVACRIIARDLAVVAPERPAPAPVAPAGQAISDMNHETVPDPRFLWWGPQRAAGVLVFAHGRAPRGGDSRGGQPQAWTRHFNNAGFDVWRFDRHPNVDEAPRAAGWLKADLQALRARGYRMVVLAGQSRGGWNTLMALDTPGLAEAHIAIAPAAHGFEGGPSHARQLDDLRQIVAAAAGAPRARLAIANFRDDPFDAQPDARAVLFNELGARAGGFIFLDRPEGLPGHGAGASNGFADRYGACLLRLATATPPPRAC